MSNPALFDIGDDVATATISPCGQYRYDLTRMWGDRDRLAMFLMLNPSKADAFKPDNTMTKCVNYAKAWGYGGLVIGNLYAFRSTDPKALRKATDPIGPENDDYLKKWVTRAQIVVCAWGSDDFAMIRALEVLGLLTDLGVTPHALRITNKGQPWHPLYLPNGLAPFPYVASGASNGGSRDD